MAVSAKVTLAVYKLHKSQQVIVRRLLWYFSSN